MLTTSDALVNPALVAYFYEAFTILTSSTTIPKTEIRHRVAGHKFWTDMTKKLREARSDRDYKDLVLTICNEDPWELAYTLAFPNKEVPTRPPKYKPSRVFNSYVMSALVQTGYHSRNEAWKDIEHLYQVNEKGHATYGEDHWHGCVYTDSVKICQTGIFRKKEGIFVTENSPGAFYTTVDAELAEVASTIQSVKEEQNTANLVYFRWDLKEMLEKNKTLKWKTFTSLDEWNAFVLKCTTGGKKEKPHPYDIVEGPWAIQGTDKQQLIPAFWHVAFCTQRACKALTQLQQTDWKEVDKDGADDFGEFQPPPEEPKTYTRHIATSDEKVQAAEKAKLEAAAEKAKKEEE